MNPQSKMVMKTPRREKSNVSTSSESDKSKDPVSVFCRLRNLPDDGESECINLISPTILALSCPTDNRVLRKDIQYEFKHIFTMYASQKEIFDHVAFPLLQDLLKGKNGLLFTYGVTGSGKTYTLTGDPYNPGMMPRCIDTIFNSIGDYQAPKFVIKSDKMNGFEVQTEADADEDRRCESRQGRSRKKPEKTMYCNDGARIHEVNQSNLYAVFISYTEIYNNIVYDLLDESSGKQLQSKILREDSNKCMYVNGVVEIEVKSAAEAFELFNIGQKRKRMGHTLLNAESSRSHSIFNIRVVQLQQDMRNSNGDRVIPAGNLLQVGQLSLVDLAGSERSSRTQNTGVRLKEASSINNSLMTLRSCMEILRDNQLNNANRLVPYRDSRLTLLFKNYFEGEGKVQMIVCVNPSASDYEESLQVMKFADMAKDVRVVKAESRYTPYRRVQKTSAKTPSTVKATPVAKLKTCAPLVFGPRIPKFKLDIENLEVYEQVLNKCEDILITRRQKSIAFNRELSSKELHLRKRLVEMNQEFTLKCSDLRSAQVQLKKERKRGQNLEVKVLEMEKFCDSLEGKNTALNNNVKKLKTNLDEKDQKLNQNLIERQRAKQKMALRQEKMSQELDDKLRKQREHYNAACMAKELKLQKVKAVLEQDIDLENIQNVPVIPMQDDDMEDDLETRHQSTVLTTPNVQSMHSGRNRIVVANRRRSRSAGEVWLEHNVVKPVPLGTVMQPTIKKRKSVSTLKKAGDITNSKQNKYCLIAQEADTDGEVETKVYKADIVSTCGGGAQVIFNDVERLRQESPVGTPRK